MYSLCDTLCVYKIKRDINSALTMNFLMNVYIVIPFSSPRAWDFFYLNFSCLKNENEKYKTAEEIKLELK